MNNRIELGRIGGIPIYLDMFFVLILLVSQSRYFTSGNTQEMSVGLLIVAGIFGSILLHELGHAAAGRLFKPHVTHIELTGLGGIAHFGSSLPRAVIPRVIIYLAGPAANSGQTGWFIVFRQPPTDLVESGRCFSKASSLKPPRRL